MTTTSPRLSRPSINANSVETIELQRSGSIGQERGGPGGEPVQCVPVVLLLAAGADGGEAVNLVKEDDGGPHGKGLVEEQPQHPLRLADPLAEAIRPCRRGR
jgi:hypothetical protein